MEASESHRHDLGAGVDGQPERAGVHPPWRQCRRLALALRTDHEVNAFGEQSRALVEEVLRGRAAAGLELLFAERLHVGLDSGHGDVPEPFVEQVVAELDVRTLAHDADRALAELPPDDGADEGRIEREVIVIR